MIKQTPEKIPESSSFADLHRKRMEKVQEGEAINVRVPFNPDADFAKLAAALAAEAYEGEPEKISLYEGKIQRSIENHLAKGRSPQDLFNWLKEQNCTSATIIGGSLHFFGETTDEKENKREEELNIAEFLKTPQLKAVSSVGETLEIARTRQIAETQTALNALRAEIEEARV